MDWSFENYAWGVNDQYKAGSMQEFNGIGLQTYAYANRIEDPAPNWPLTSRLRLYGPSGPGGAQRPCRGLLLRP